jgi:hypothetical protein
METNHSDVPSKHRRDKRLRLRTLDQLDKRTQAAKLAHSLVSALCCDLGGDEVVTVAQRELVKRAALLGALLEDYEVRWLKRERLDLDAYVRAVGAQRRVLQTIGLERRARHINQMNDEAYKLYERELAEFGTE